VEVRAAPSQIDCVVRVSPVGGAPTLDDEVSVVELAQVIRDQALGLVHQAGQLAHGAVAAHQFAEQTPPDRMGEEAHDSRGIDRDVGGGRRHVATLRPTAPIHQISLIECAWVLAPLLPSSQAG
jgi:hypothetical protein